MSPSRREFIKQFGVMLASLVVSSCTPPLGSGPTASPDATPTMEALAATARERLRATWQRLNDLAAETLAAFEGSERKRDALAAEHRAALDELVDDGELVEAVAGQVQTAFEAAAYHVWRLNAPITCYEPVLINYKPVTSDQLVEQANLLAERDDLDPQVIAQAQAAIAKEMAFLNMSPEAVDALYQQILNEQQNDQPIPAFEEVDLEVSAQDLEAAQFLTGLLLGDAR